MRMAGVSISDRDIELVLAMNKLIDKMGGEAGMREIIREATAIKEKYKPEPGPYYSEWVQGCQCA